MPLSTSSYPEILVIDGDRGFREFLGDALKAEGFPVRLAANAHAGLACAADRPSSLVVLEQDLPDRSGLDVLNELRRGIPQPRVIVVTANASFGSAVRAIKAGAFHYLAKPFAFDELLECVRTEPTGGRERTAEFDVPELACMVGESAVLRLLKSKVARIANAPVNRVLIFGESGTGKELVARAIHKLSPRAAAPLVSVNCAALTDTLLMSELFGHERGAFTDARERRIGLFEAAAGGTLFFDEVSEMGAHAQASLLRVLEERSVRRVGGTAEIPLDIRVIAATNQPLDQAVADGRFRADLYYRLNTVQLSVPPLRERGDDVITLAESFCGALAPAYGIPPPTISSDAQQVLRSYSWPGNVRELRNAIEHAFVDGGRGELTAGDLPLNLESCPPPHLPMGFNGFATLPFHDAKQQVIEDFERRYLAAALHRAGGNVSKAARDCGVLRQALQRLLSRHRLDVSAYR